MSCSYKYTPVYKGDKDKSAKRRANKKIRQKAKLNPDDTITGKSNDYRREYESWEICDYRLWGEPIWQKESTRNLSDDKDRWEKCYRRK